MPYINISDVLRFFEEISKIPRTSGNENGVREYLSSFAAERNLAYSSDKAGNLLIKKPAHNSVSAPVILQAHMDMVGEKLSSSDHDFSRDPIKLVFDGDMLHADKTTLGADNGIGLSVILAVLDSSDMTHPPLECVFTVEEETGLTGAAAFDFASLEGRRYLNLDSEGEGVATVACAGGARCDISLPVNKGGAPTNGSFIKIIVDGLAGGHSGEDIGKRRTNACVFLGKIISSAFDAVRSGGSSCELVSFCGGSKDNAIPRNAEAVVCCGDADIFVSALNEAAGEEQQYFCDEDMLCRLSVSTADFCKNSVGDSLLELLAALPCGVIGMEPDMPEFVRVSANIGIVKADENGADVCYSVRSSSDDEIDKIIESAKITAAGLGGTLLCRSRYPGWERKENSSVRPIYAEAVKKVFGTDARFCSIHAGLECGVVSKLVPDMDMISIGPTIKNMHTPEETVSLSSVERFIRIVCIMLECM